MTIARLLRIWGHRWRSIARQDAVDREVASELAFHRELLVRERLDAGMPREEAERDAAHALGNVAVLRDQCRDQRRVTWFHDLRQDVGYGVRVLRRSRGFAAIAITSLAFAIGGCAAVLSVARTIAFGELPFPAAERLVVIRTYPHNAPGQQAGARASDYRAWRERSAAFEEIGIAHGFPGDLSGDADEPAQRIDGYLATASLFRALGAQPLAGRIFDDAEAGSSPRPIVISQRLWRERFAADAAIVGRVVRLNRQPALIVGVLPATFVFPDGRLDYWMPMDLSRGQPIDTSRLYNVVGRLKPGVTVEQAAADLNRIAGELAVEAPETGAGWGVRLLPLRTVQFGWTREPLITLALSVAIVLVLACVNLAGLLLARGAARGPELALRMALGAGRPRIIRQLITESLLLSLAAGACSAAVVWWGIRGIRSLAPLPGLPPMPPIAIDPGVVATVVCLTVATSLAIGVGPALVASRGGVADPFRHCTAAADHRPRRQRIRAALVAAQVALALVLLAGAGLLVNTVARIASRDLGFEPRGLMMADFQIPGPEFLRPAGTFRGANVFAVTVPPALTLSRVLDRLAAVPGVESAAGVSHHPIHSFLLPRMPLAGLDNRRQPMSTFPAHFLVTPRFFTTMRATIVRGREIEAGDTAAGAWVAVINETMARRYWPGQDAIGREFVIDTLPDERPRRIVGIVRDMPTRREQAAPDAVFYTSYLQQPARVIAPWGGIGGRMTFVIRAAGDPSSLVPDVRRAVAGVEPDRPLTAISTTELGIYFWLRRTYVLAVLGLAIVATVLSAIGLYGIMSYGLSRRTREIAIRVALGAGAWEVVRTVGLPSLAVVTTGVGAGLVGAVGFGRAIESQLWGVSATDGATFMVASLLLIAVAGVSCIPTIRRALRIDPSAALRSE
jgi:putative ABC transport system permease protein